jgi:hypothetical protein
MGTLVWTALLVALAGAALLIWGLRGARGALVVGERGLLARDHGLGWIRWNEIEGAYPPSVRDTDSLLLRLRLSERLSRRLRRRNPALEPPPRPGESFELRVDLSGAEMGPVELLQEIVRRGGGPDRKSEPR